jgi:hypothetical protein
MERQQQAQVTRLRGILTVKPPQSPITLKTGWSYANTIVFYRAVSTAIVDRNVDLRRPSVQGVLKQAVYCAVQ